jgi:hypothetical protein
MKLFTWALAYPDLKSTYIFIQVIFHRLLSSSMIYISLPLSKWFCNRLFSYDADFILFYDDNRLSNHKRGEIYSS